MAVLKLIFDQTGDHTLSANKVFFQQKLWIGVMVLHILTVHKKNHFNIFWKQVKGTSEYLQQDILKRV